MAKNSGDIAIRVEGLYKDFKLPHEKHDSIKSLFTKPFKGKSGYEVQHALKDINLEIKKGEFFGIVGRNGSGKSTLLKILAGIYQPTKGKVQVEGRLVPFIELGVGFDPELTGRENVYLNGAMFGFSTKEVDKMYQEIVDFAELEKFMDQKLKNYSSGMQVRLAFSMAIRSEADVLLIDEVLAVGDADFQRKCYNYFKSLKKNKKTVIFVTHDMEAVREFCDRAVLINGSTMVSVGSAQEVANNYLQIFISDTENNNSNGKLSENKRWGRGDALIEDVSVEARDYVVVEYQVSVHKKIEKISSGLHISASDGHDITAVNNKMLLLPDIVNAHPSQKVKLEWRVLNIFNDGEYSVTLTLVDGSGDVLDWRADVAKFKVKKPQRSTTAVLPPIDMKAEVVSE